MVNTHEEWMVAVKQNCDVRRGEDRWWNAVMWYPKSKSGQRYVRTEEEARSVLNYAYERWNGEKIYNEKGERYETSYDGGIGITLVSTKETDEDMRIVKHKIKKRIVTEWEVVEEL